MDSKAMADGLEGRAMMDDAVTDDSTVNVGNMTHDRHMPTTQQDRKRRNESFTRNRVNDFYGYMNGTLPPLATMHIATSESRLAPKQQVMVSRLVQAGIVSKCVLSASDASVRIPPSVEGKVDEIVGLIRNDGILDVDALTQKQRRRINRISNEADKARNLCIEMNLGLVNVITRREGRKRGLDQYTYNEILEEGKIGMIQALDRFDPDAGFKFSTYATYWIQQRIMAYLNNASKMIRMPSNMNTLYRRITVAMKDLRVLYPSDDMITPEMIYECLHAKDESDKVTLEQVEYALRMRKETISMDSYVTDDGSKTIEHMLPADDDDMASTVLGAVGMSASFEAMVSLVSDPLSRFLLKEVCAEDASTDHRRVNAVARRHGMTAKEVRSHIDDAEEEIRRVIRFRHGRVEEDMLPIL